MGFSLPTSSQVPCSAQGAACGVDQGRSPSPTGGRSPFRLWARWTCAPVRAAPLPSELCLQGGSPKRWSQAERKRVRELSTAARAKGGGQVANTA